MLTALTFRGRLPGVMCESALPPVGEAPLRLDIAAFVGFAERGPLHTPVAVEDIGQYQAVFGRDLVVARRSGQPIYAQLPTAVQLFFDNGGRRCYVVRVAGSGAYPNRFRMPGVVVWNPDTQATEDVVLESAWAGRWSDTVRVGTQLAAQPLQASIYWPPDLAGTIALDAETPTATTVRPGDIVRLRFALAPEYAIMFPVAGVTRKGPAAATTRGVPVTLRARAADIVALPAEELGSPPLEPLALYTRIGDAWAASLTLGALRQADILRFTLVVQEGDDIPERWDDLQFNQGPAFWGDQLIRLGDCGMPAGASAYLARSTRLRAPAAAKVPPLYLPRDMAAWLNADEFARPLPDHTALPEDVVSRKDGLDTYQPTAMFLDPRLRGTDIYTLLTEADRIMYLMEPALADADSLDDVDARGDQPTSPLIPRAQRLRGIHSLIPVAEVALIAIPDAMHTGWPGDPVPEAAPPIPMPQPAPGRDWSYFDQCVLPTPTPPHTPSLPERAPCAGPRTTALPGAPTNARTELLHLPTALAPAQYQPDQLLEIQVALVRLCAARGDMLAVLGLPESFETRQALDWQKQIVGPLAAATGPLSYATAYHPWLQIREARTPELAPLRALAPDGAICGMIAARELARGPWIAPANQPLTSVVGLTPKLDTQAWESLFNAQLNLVRHLPGQFTPMSAHTLSQDRQLLQVSVRRLLIYLRKLALQRGMQYVFETNNERFRQRVQGAFEATLGAIVASGGLVAFQVVTDDSINTPNDRDSGRFLVALKVAPTLPIEFITVVLLRAGEGLLDTQEVGRG
jgi:hypothetical protein